MEPPGGEGPLVLVVVPPRWAIRGQNCKYLGLAFLIGFLLFFISEGRAPGAPNLDHGLRGFTRIKMGLELQIPWKRREPPGGGTGTNTGILVGRVP